MECDFDLADPDPTEQRAINRHTRHHDFSLREFDD